MDKNKKILIKQIGSPIRRDGRQKKYLTSLGLGKKMNRAVILEDNLITRGLIKKVGHLLQVEEQK